VEPSHGVDSERGEIEVDRLYPELAHGAQVVDDLGVAAGEQEPLAVVGFRGRRGSVAMDPKGERDACRIAADVVRQAWSVLILLGVGLVSFPSLGYALVPPAAFVGVATIEGQFITPTVLGHRLTLNPLAVLLAIAFWAWLWGPIGAFLAVPLTIVILVTMTHLFPPEESKLPD
jgi:hypothetical protein